MTHTIVQNKHGSQKLIRQRIYLKSTDQQSALLSLPDFFTVDVRSIANETTPDYRVCSIRQYVITTFLYFSAFLQSHGKIK